MKPNFKLLDEIENSKGTNKKVELLQQAVKDKDTKEFLDILYNNEIYGIAETSLNKIVNDTNKLFVDEKTFPEQLEFMKSLTGNAKLDSLSDFLSRYDKLSRKWFKRAILKDFPKVGVKSYNKALKKEGFETIEDFNLQLCESVILDTDGKVLDWNGLDTTKTNYVQHKLDGSRLYVQKNGNVISFISRNNKEFFSLNLLRDYLMKNYINDDFIFDGEVVSPDGDFNSLMKKMRRNNQMNVNDFEYRIFDVLKFNDRDFKNETQKSRFSWLEKEFKNKYGIIKLPDTFITTNSNSIEEIFWDIVNKGGEGIVIKPEDGLYEYDSRKYWWKMKPVYEGTFEIFNVEIGSGKNRGKISALWIKDKYSSVETKVGSGLTELDINNLTQMGKDKIIGKFIDIYYNEILEKGLRFPRFKAPNTNFKENLRFRYDKEEADDLIPLREKFDKIKEDKKEKQKTDKLVDEVNSKLEW